MHCMIMFWIVRQLSTEIVLLNILEPINVRSAQEEPQLNKEK